MKKIRNHVALPILGLGVAALAAACGGSSSGSGGNASVGTSGGSTTAASATAVHSGPNGSYVTDASGRTLYIFSKDTSTTSTCSGTCATEWPPYKEDGSQVVFKGHPLYFFADDKSAGDMNGQGVNDFGGLWTTVAPDGSPVSSSEPSGSPSSSGGSSSEWG